MSYALRQQHGLPGELKREHALFSGIGQPSSSLQSTPLPKAEPRSTIGMTIATNNGAGGRATATQAAVSSMSDATPTTLLDASNRSPANRLVNTKSVPPVNASVSSQRAVASRATVGGVLRPTRPVSPMGRYRNTTMSTTIKMGNPPHLS